MASTQNLKIKQPRLLIVEGKDDHDFFRALLTHLEKIGHRLDVQLINAEGKDNLAPLVRNLQAIKGYHASQVQKIGLVRDRDESQTDPFASLCHALRSGGFTAPEAPFQLSSGQPQSIICLVPPQHERTGRMLEDICLASFQDDPALGCVETYYTCLAQQGIELSAAAQAKGWLRTYLASKPDPTLNLGIAADKGYWNWASPVFDPLKDFLLQLATI